MSWKNIKLIFAREVRDQLRDRRTLFMIAVMPLFFYPALGIGMMQMTMLFSVQTRTVVILGADHLPADPPLLDDGQIADAWFDLGREDAKSLQVYSDLPGADSEEPLVQSLLTDARAIREILLRQRELEVELDQALDDEDAEQITRLNSELTRNRQELGELFAVSRIQVLIVVPEGLAESISRVNEQLADRTLQSDALADYERPIILQNSADEKSMIAYRRVSEALSNWEQQILRQRLSMAHLPATLPTPINARPVDLAEKDQLSANLWSKLFPALLVIMAVTGAFYPAVDLAAGEKERGTMETLLISPAKRGELVMGKFLTVMLFSMSTAVLNLVSMGMTGSYIVSLAGSGPFASLGGVSFPPVSALLWIVVFLVPLAALFSALCLALATFARSSKEGQYYLFPLMMITLGLTVFCLSPAVEINPFYSVMPVMGVALLLKGMLLTTVSADSLYWYVIPVLLTSIGYSLLALWWAIEQFNREDVLFREAERFELRLWIRHIFRDKEATPSFTEAGLCFLLIMFLQFGAMKFMGQVIQSASTDGEQSQRMMQILLSQQLVIIACPALFMGLLLTTSMKRTFRLRLPSLQILSAAVVLPLVLHPLSVELMSSLKWFFPAPPPGIAEALESMSDPNMSFWLLLLVFAGAPAICEEIAFRGFILSGFSYSHRAWLAIVLSSLTFGIMHMIPQQVFNASLLGLVLGLLALRGRSLFACMIFHFIYNSLQVCRSRVSDWTPSGSLQQFLSTKDGIIRYEWPTLVIAALVAIVVIRHLALMQPTEMTEQTVAEPPDDEHADHSLADRSPVNAG